MTAPQDVQKRWSTEQLITGIETADWLKLMSLNQFNVDATYLHRALWVTGWSLPATLLGRFEDARYQERIEAIDLSPSPIFVIGHWRSGTTHLHNLLGRVPGHTYSTVFQAVFPTCFLTTDPFLPSLTSRFMGGTRTYDNVKQGWGEAAEDEIALAKLTGMSPYLAFMFPDHAPQYERFVDFLECTSQEKERWKSAFMTFLKKIHLQTNGDRIIVKSCTHTARIRLILEMFPDAKFIHIHRHPYEVFSSTLHMRSHTDWENFFHLPHGDVAKLREQQTLTMGQRLFERVLADRELVPDGQYTEVAFTDLTGNEVDTMRRLYDELQLDGWNQAEPSIQSYVDSLKGYKRNQLALETRLRDRVWEAWQCAFDAFGYTREYEF